MKKVSEWAHQQLNQVDTVFKTDIRYLIQGNVWLGSSHLVAIGVLMVTSIVLGRNITEFQYGQYQYILSISEVIGAFALGGFATVIVQLVAKGQDGILPSVAKKNLQWSGGVVIGALAVALYYAFRHTPVYATAFLFVAVLMPIYMSASLSDYFLLGKKDFKTSGLLNIFASIGIATCLISAVFLHANLLTLLLTYFISRTFFEVICYLITVYLYPRTQASIEKKAFKYAAHLSVIGILGTFANQADALLIFHFLGPVSLAIYSFAIAPAELIKGFVKKIGAMALPRFANYSLKQIRQRLLGRMIILSACMVPVIALYIVCAPFLFKLVLPQYINAVWYSQLFSFSLLIAAPLVLVAPVLRTIAIKEQLYAFNISGEVFQMIFLTIGTLYFGLIGTIIAYLCARMYRLLFGCFLIWTTPEEIALAAYKES